MYHRSLFCGLSCLKCFNESQKSFVCRILNRFWRKSRAFFRDNSRIASSYNEKLISTLSGLREIQPHQRTLFIALYPIGKKGWNYPATVSILLPRTSWIAANRNKLWSKLAALRAARLHYLISILKLISRVNRQPRVRRRDIRERDGEGCHLRADTRENVFTHIQDMHFAAGEKVIAKRISLSIRTIRGVPHIRT